jgi:signal transduction histidine kinase/DNA-binding response OmpR family regulator
MRDDAALPERLLPEPADKAMCTQDAKPLILLIEDDRGLCEFARRRLEQDGLHVTVANTGQQAVAWLDDHHPDLMLLDLMLPDMTGREVLQALAKRGQKVPFIIMTGYGDERVAVEMMKQGALEYLTKSAAFPDLLPSVVQGVLERLAQQNRLAATEKALKENQDAETLFRERLTALLEVNNELMEAPSFESLCRKAVELGRARLGFDRLGIWFASPDGLHVNGAFGTNEQGRIRDERRLRARLDDRLREMLVARNPIRVARTFCQDVRDDQGRPVGSAEQAWASIWDGQKNSGLLITDNLLQQRPITDHDCELLGLFASSLGHLCLLRKTEEQIRELNEQLERRVQDRTAELTAVNRELEAFCYSVSHDLRAPLRAIDGFSRAVCDDCAEQLSDQARSYLQRVCAASQRMARLIDDLLQLSRTTRAEMHFHPVDLTAIARAAARELQAGQPERKAEFIIAEDLVARGDDRLLQIAIENLLGNAWKFTGNKPAARIEFQVEWHDGRRVYLVRDNGAGFDMVYADKLFGAFQRLHAVTEFPGMGIGLATVQRIIHRHGGRIWAEGRVDEGATFFFTLPAADAETSR